MPSQFWCPLAHLFPGRTAIPHCWQGTHSSAKRRGALKKGWSQGDKEAAQGIARDYLRGFLRTVEDVGCPSGRRGRKEIDHMVGSHKSTPQCITLTFLYTNQSKVQAVPSIGCWARLDTAIERFQSAPRRNSVVRFWDRLLNKVQMAKGHSFVLARSSIDLSKSRLFPFYESVIQNLNKQIY